MEEPFLFVQRMGDKMKSSAEYKELTIKEFSKAADVYETGHSGIYEAAYSLDEIRSFCDCAGLKIEKLEAGKKFRMHLVARK